MLNKKQLLRKSLLFGVGLAAYAKSNSEKLIKELIGKQQLSVKEGKQLVDKVYNEAERSSKRVAGVLNSELKKVATQISKSAPKKAVKRKAKKRKR